MSKIPAPLFAAALLAAASALPAHADAQADLTKAGCMACHAKDKKLVGPSFKDIAAKYKGKDVVADLAAKVRAGGKGVWGPVPMPPTGPDKIGDDALKAGLQFIVSTH